MELDVALRVFKDLEKARYMFDDEPFPRFSVRLDAGSDIDERRTYRLFIRRETAAGKDKAEDDFRFVLDLVQEHGLDVDVENAGFELS
jgi:hypothetical protein